MKKTLSILIACLALAGVARAAMDNFSVSYSLVTTNSDTSTQFCRGELEGVYVNVTATKTNVVLITMDGQTLFSKTCSDDGYYPIRVPVYGTTASALTDSYSIWNNITNSVGTNPIYGKMPLAGEVTIRAAGAADTTGTNAVAVKLMFSK